MNASQRKEFSREYTRINRAYEKRYFGPMVKAIQAKANRTIAALRSGGTDAAMRYLSQDMTNEAAGEIVRDIYVRVGLRHARRQNAMLRAEPMRLKRLGFNDEWTAYILDYLQRFLFDMIVLRMAETTRDALMRAITQGVAEGKGVDDIVRDITNWPFARFQAARIVRTEVNRAANTGQNAANSTFEFEQTKEWIAVGDSRTRGVKPKDHASHIALDGQVIDENDTWVDPRNGDLLQFPGDPKASAESTINCRCTHAFAAKRDANGRLIPKNRERSRVSVIMPGDFNRQRQTIVI